MEATQKQRMRPNSLPCPILVTGSARSGVSMTAGIFKRCGAWVGCVDQSYENVEVRDKTVNPYLEFIGADKMCQNPLPDPHALQPLVGLVRRVETAAKFQGYRYGPWMYKSPAIALTWPIWAQAFPDSKWVIVRRDDRDILNSCIKTGFMRGYSDPREWQQWIDAFKDCFEEMKSSLVLVREVWPQKYVNGDFGEIAETVEWLGLRWNPDKVKEYVNPSLWRDSDGKSDIS
jgi:hypothetical protein